MLQEKKCAGQELFFATGKILYMGLYCECLYGVYGVDCSEILPPKQRRRESKQPDSIPFHSRGGGAGGTLGSDVTLSS